MDAIYRCLHWLQSIRQSGVGEFDHVGLVGVGNELSGQSLLWIHSIDFVRWIVQLFSSPRVSFFRNGVSTCFTFMLILA
jgi:hypothetical protein